MLERADKKKNIDKVAASVAKNPLQTVREIGKDTGVSKSTVAIHLDKLDKIGQKDNRIISLTDKDFEMMQLIQEQKFDRLNDKTEKVNNSDINNWDKTAQARYTIFRGDVTDEKGGLKNVMAQYSDDELLNIINNDK